MAELEEFMAALGGEDGGHIENGVWTCVCGATGSEAEEAERRSHSLPPGMPLAALGLYWHRREVHANG